MNLYFTIPFLTLVAIFQSTAVPQIRIGSGYPDLMLLSVVSWELVQTRGEGYTWAFIGGLILDLISGGPFGASILGLLAAAAVADRVGGGLARQQVTLPLISSFIGTFAFHGVYLIVLRVFGWTIEPAAAVFRVVLPSAVINMVLSPFLFRAMIAIHRRVTPPGMSWE
jgi:rod shape-determining protein MreD